MLSSVVVLLFKNLYKNLLLSTLLVSPRPFVIDSADKYIRALETGRVKYTVVENVRTVSERMSSICQEYYVETSAHLQ